MENFSELVTEGVVLMAGRRTGFLCAGMNEINWTLRIDSQADVDVFVIDTSEHICDTSTNKKQENLSAEKRRREYGSKNF